MSALATLMRGRKAAERLMLQKCEIGRVKGTVTDPETGKVVPKTTRLYAGKCKVQGTDGVGQAGAESVAELTATVTRMTVHIPVGAADPKPGDIITITESPVDPRFVGRRFRVTSNLPIKAMATADRIPVEEV